jgi:hypothetical protein
MHRSSFPCPAQLCITASPFLALLIVCYPSRTVATMLIHLSAFVGFSNESIRNRLAGLDLSLLLDGSLSWTMRCGFRKCLSTARVDLPSECRSAYMARNACVRARTDQSFTACVHAWLATLLHGPCGYKPSTEALLGGSFVDRSAERFEFTCSARRSPSSCALSLGFDHTLPAARPFRNTVRLVLALLGRLEGMA